MLPLHEAAILQVPIQAWMNEIAQAGLPGLKTYWKLDDFDGEEEDDDGWLNMEMSQQKLDYSVCSLHKYPCYSFTKTKPKHSDQTKMRHMKSGFKNIQDKSKTQREMNKDKYPCKSEINGSGMSLLPPPSFRERAWPLSPSWQACLYLP